MLSLGGGGGSGKKCICIKTIYRKGTQETNPENGVAGPHEGETDHRGRLLG